MPVEAIGSTLSNQSTTGTNSVLNQEEFLKLFLTELNFQDPLEPINNREFLAQMAQFSALEQNRQTTESVNNLVFMSSTAQSVGLLGKVVNVAGIAGEQAGKVSSVQFTQSGPSLVVTLDSGAVLKDVKLSQVISVIN